MSLSPKSCSLICLFMYFRFQINRKWKYWKRLNSKHILHWIEIECSQHASQRSDEKKSYHAKYKYLNIYKMPVKINACVSLWLLLLFSSNNTRTRRSTAYKLKHWLCQSHTICFFFLFILFIFFFFFASPICYLYNKNVLENDSFLFRLLWKSMCATER